MAAVTTTVTATDVAPSDAEWLSLGTSTVYEASGVACALDPVLFPAWDGARVIGPAYPVFCPPGTNLTLHLAVERAPSGSVLVVDGSARLVGYWGEVLTVAAQARGIAGLVIDGGVRDVDALAAMRFPVFCRGVSMIGTGKNAVGTTGTPASVCGVRVVAGDLVLGDRDGVLVLAADRVARTYADATARQAKEREFARRIRAGESTVDIYGWRGVAEELERERG